MISSRKPVAPLVPPTGPAPRISFLIAAWNEAHGIAACLESVVQLSYPNLEVVVCAGGSDRSFEIASQIDDPRLIVLEQCAGDGKQHSLRRCLERASGEIIYQLDADCRIPEATFARVAGPVVRREEEVVNGTVYTPLPGQLDNPFVVSQCANWVYTALHRPAYCARLTGANSALRRDLLEQVGAFHPEVGVGEDYELAKRLVQAGARIRYAFDASIVTEHPTRFRAYFNQQARWLRSAVVHGPRFGAWREAATNLRTSLVGLAMLALPCLCLTLMLVAGTTSLTLRLIATIWAVLFLHALCSRVRYLKFTSLWLGIQIPWRTYLLLPGYVLLDFLAWTIPLFQYPVRSWREHWS